MWTMSGPASVRIVNLRLEPQFKMSYTRFEVCDLAFVVEVIAARYEADIPRFIMAVHIDPIHLESRVVPAVESLDVLQELGAVRPPPGVYANPTLTVVLVHPARWGVAASDRRSEAIE